MPETSKVLIYTFLYRFAMSMIQYDYHFRVQYADTDKMGTMHHAQFIKYYETARCELFRHLGVPYAEIEAAGFLLPVIGLQVKYHRTTFYDEHLVMKTRLKEIKGVRIVVAYEVVNEKQEKINEAEVTLAFVSADTWKPCNPPAFVTDAVHKQITR